MPAETPLRAHVKDRSGKSRNCIKILPFLKKTNLNILTQQILPHKLAAIDVGNRNKKLLLQKALNQTILLELSYCGFTLFFTAEEFFHYTVFITALHITRCRVGIWFSGDSIILSFDSSQEIIQGIDGSARKPTLRQDTGYMVEKTYHDIEIL